MKDTELRQEKDRELYSVYLRGIRENNFANMHEAAEWVRLQPAPKFFVSSKSLANYIGERMRGIVRPKMFQDNCQKMEILYGMFMDFVEQNPDCTLSRERICELLVEEPAPRFFICHESAMKAIVREKERQVNELRRRLLR